MNVLFLTLINIENINERGIYTDLIRVLAEKDINVYVITPRERRMGLATELESIKNINILRVKTGNITKTSIIEKGISTLMIESQFLQAAKKHFSEINFDMVIYSTPPITFGKVIQYFRKKCRCKTYLMLKDIFPQNAVDIEMMKRGSLLWKYFRKKEEKLYNMSDFIGCMSQGNVDYLLNNNESISRDKVGIFPNAVIPIEKITKKNKNADILNKYNIPEEAVLFVYGGNLGKPQGIDFLIDVIDQFYRIKNGYLLIVGSGTEYLKIKEHIELNKPKNVLLHEKLPKDEYDSILESADVGLIFLDKRFTIPNFPSRLTAYMEYSIPVLAATDKNTDMKEVLLNSESGLWVESGDSESFVEQANNLSENKILREKMGENGRFFLENNYDVRKTVDIILKHLK